MDFGKLPLSALSKVDFALPARDSRAFPKSPKAKPLRIGMGCPVWNVKGWVGSIYPENAKPTEYLYHYARQFNSIELNTTHYRTPDSNTVQRWCESVPADFRFNPKVLQEISHRGPLSANSSVAREFFKSVQLFGDKLGLCFLQLPPFFGKSHLPELGNFLLGVSKHIPLAIEVRDPSLFQNHQLIPELFDMLSKAGVHSVITDVAGRRDVLHMSLTSDRVMVRFIGNDAHSTDFQRLKDWEKRLQEWVAQGVSEIEFFLHEPEDRATPEVFPGFARDLHQKTDWPFRVPHLHQRTEQLGLF